MEGKLHGITRPTRWYRGPASIPAIGEPVLRPLAKDESKFFAGGQHRNRLLKQWGIVQIIASSPSDVTGEASMDISGWAPVVLHDENNVVRLTAGCDEDQWTRLRDPRTLHLPDRSLCRASTGHRRSCCHSAGDSGEDRANISPVLKVEIPERVPELGNTPHFLFYDVEPTLSSLLFRLPATWLGELSNYCGGCELMVLKLLIDDSRKSVLIVMGKRPGVIPDRDL